MEDFNKWKETLKTNSNIVSVVSKYVTLQKKGKTWWANCPFHFEKTPSFAVNESEQYYHCFGCGASGDVFGFVQKMEACDFWEACEILAKDANMKMPVFQDNEAINKMKQEKEIAFKVLKDAALYYVHNLSLPQGQLGRDYIAKRKLTPQTVRDFGIGYSLGWNEVVTHLTGQKGYTISELKLAGMVDEKEGKVYDAYAKRLVFPILNNNSEVIGFSARNLEDGNFAKYKNTAQTVVFDKSRVLYGIHNIKKVKQTEPLNEIIIVEGQIDLITMYQFGIKNAVATMGTALTPLHAKELKRYCNKIVLCFDGDNAGKKATARSIDILSAEGLEVYVTTIPQEDDPDEFLNEFGHDAFYDLIVHAKYWTEYEIATLAQSYHMDKPNEKNEFVSGALEIVKKLDSSTEQTIYLEMVKNFSGISLDILQADLNRLLNKPVDKQIPAKTMAPDFPATKENAYVKAIKFVLASLLFKKEYAKLEDLKVQYIANGDYKKLVEYLQTCQNENKKPIVSMMFDLFDVEKNEDIKSIVEYEFFDDMDYSQYYKDCIKTITVAALNKQQSDLLEQIKSVSDLALRRELNQKLNEVLQALRANK